MTKPSVAATIVLPDNLRSGALYDAITAYDALLTNQLTSLFPANLTADAVHAHLTQHLAAWVALGSSRTDVSISVEARTDAIKRGTKVHAQLVLMVDGSFPPGTPGRADFFPKNETDPTLGDLLTAIGDGAEKRKMPLPLGLTPVTLRALGAEVNASLANREKSGNVRKGRSKVAGALEKKTAEIRRRLRKIATGWYGLADAKLLEYGIQPRKPAGGRPRKKGDAPAVAPT